MKIKNILLGCIFFKNLTGSEVYFYELAKTLTRMGYNVTVAAYTIGSGKITELIDSEVGKNKIKIISIGNLDTLNFSKYDLIIASHFPIVRILANLKKFSKSNTKIISIIHGEYNDLEKPYVSDLIDHYIGIRPSIVDILKNKYGIERCSMLWNPFDFNKFHFENKKKFDETKEGNKILYCGTIDYLRKDSIYDMAKECQEKKWKLILVGANGDNYLNDLLSNYSCVEYHEATNDIADYVYDADATCGIFVGRTTIEGWLCGIPGFIYTLDENNKIIKREFQETPDDYKKFDEKETVKKILEIANE